MTNKISPDPSFNKEGRSKKKSPEGAFLGSWSSQEWQSKRLLLKQKDVGIRPAEALGEGLADRVIDFGGQLGGVFQKLDQVGPGYGQQFHVDIGHDPGRGVLILW